MALTLGTRLGSYEILSPLGAGGMGEVYRAKHIKLGRDVAIKVLPSEVASDPERLQRFEREARTASSLNHPNIVTIHDIDEQQGTHYIAMELVEGRTLRDRLDGSPLPNEEILHLTTQIAEGLARAHAAGIVHRDLKPENLMITEDGLVKILDFGLAKLSPQAEDGDAVTDITTVEQATRAGIILGTVPYMSPEQAAGRRVDHRSDQFSFGSILYEMATGRRAFKKDTILQTLAAVIEAAPVPVGKLSGQNPARLVSIIERCLAKDPAKRFDSTRELAEELKAVPEILPAWRVRRRVLWAAVGLAAAALLAALLPNLGRWWPSQAPGTAPPPIQAVAVLPLQNLSGDPEQEFFVDGMTEALITDLAKIGALKVISRSSAMRYKGTDQPLADIARELGVDALIEGSALRSGDRVRITAQLIDPETDQALWADSYERAMRDVLSLQSEVAQAVAREIGAVVTPEEEARLTARRPVDPEAHEAYLKGVFYSQRFTPQDLQTALLHFERALELDPDYALAHVGVSQVWVIRMQAGLLPPREASPQAMTAVLKALELDGTLSEAHTELAKLRTWYEWDWEGGETEFRRAIELNPSDAEARVFYSHFLTIFGRPEEATAQIERALELDPLNPFFQALYGVQLMLAGRFDDAVTQLRKTLEMAPGFGFGHTPLWSALHELGRNEEALAAAKAAQASRGDAEIVEALERGYEEGGYRGAMRRAAETLAARSLTTYVPPMPVVNLYDYAGDTEKALEWLQKAYEAREPNMPYIGAIPFSDEVRNDPRFRAMLRRLKLPVTAPRTVVGEGRENQLQPGG